jgi:hypothetical protein
LYLILAAHASQVGDDPVKKPAANCPGWEGFAVSQSGLFSRSKEEYTPLNLPGFDRRT